MNNRLADFTTPAPSVRTALRLIFSKRTPWPSEVPVEQQQPPTPRRPGEVVLTFIGHSTFLIQTAERNILIDPVYSQHAGPWGRFGPRRVRQPGVAFDDLPEIAVVLISHNHYDHCDLPTLRRIDDRFHPLFITPAGNERLLKSAGVRRVQELDWWETVGEISLTPAKHFSARTLFDRNRALWGGFMIAMPSVRIFFAGDTGYAPHFNEIRQRYGPVDLALLPIGAYEPRWFMKDIHMNPAEAVQAHLDLAAKRSFGMHFGTFRLTTEGIDEPVQSLEAVAPEAFRTLDFGESFSLPL